MAAIIDTIAIPESSVPEAGDRRLVERITAARTYILELEKELAEWKTTGRRLSSIFERAPVAIFVKDFSGCYLHANPIAATIFDRDLDALIGSTDTELFGDEIALELRDIDQYVATTNRPFRYEARRIKEGRERVFQTTKWPWVTEVGRTSGIIAMSRDVTDQKNAEEYRALQRAVSRSLSSEGALELVLSSLLKESREAFGADIAFLWREREPGLLTSVHDVARPGFADDLVACSARLPLSDKRSLVAVSLELASPVVGSPGSEDERGRLAVRSGLRTIFTIPFLIPGSSAILEIMTAESRIGTESFLENLEDASRRVVDFAKLRNAHARITELERT